MTEETNEKQVPDIKEKITEDTSKQNPLEDITETFLCYQCKLKEEYHYKGVKPPFCKQIQILEPSYIMKDPFNPPNKGHILILGTDCSQCGKPVCKDFNCSIFYGKTFCRICMNENVLYFPQKIQQIVRKINVNNAK